MTKLSSTPNAWALHRNIQIIKDPASGRILCSGYYPVTAGDQPGTRQISFVHSLDHFGTSGIVKSPFYDVTTGEYPVAVDNTIAEVDSFSVANRHYIQADSTHIWILDTTNGIVYQYLKDGTFVTSWSCEISTGTHKCMSVDSTYVYIGGVGYSGQMENYGYLPYAHVAVFDKSGVHQYTIQCGANGYAQSIEGIHVNSSGDLIMLNWTAGLQRFDIYGNEVWTLGTARGMGTGQFWFAYDLVDDGAHIYIIDYDRKALIKRQLSDGAFVAETILSVDAAKIRGIEYYDGKIYLPSVAGVQIYNTSDLALHAAPVYPSDVNFWYPWGNLVFDGTNWWAVDKDTNTVRKFTITL